MLPKKDHFSPIIYSFKTKINALSILQLLGHSDIRKFLMKYKGLFLSFLG